MGTTCTVHPGNGNSLKFTFVIGDADSQLGKGYNFIAWTGGITPDKNWNDEATVVLGPLGSADAQPAGNRLICFRHNGVMWATPISIY